MSRATRPPEPGPIRTFDFPTIHRHRLGSADGLTVLAARHGDMPLVSARLVLDAGASAEPAGAEGAARLTAHALETGTERRSAVELSWAFETLGIELRTGTGWDSASVGFTVPADRLEPALELLAEVVRQPAFPADQVERLRDEQSATILQRRKDPRALADDMAARFIFARDVPYGRPIPGTAESVAGLDRDAVVRFYRDRYRPGSAALVLTGAVEPDRAAHMAERLHGWDAGTAEPVNVEVRARVDQTTIFLVNRPGAVQSEIRIGHVGVERLHQDYFNLLVFNTILGGAFTSRLNMNLREKHGFTYGARSRFAFRRRPGPFSVQVAVATDVTARAIEEALNEIRALRDDGVTTEELDAARDYLRGIRPLQVQTTDQLASRIAEVFTFDLPTDYFQHVGDRIAAVSADDVLRAARQHVRPDRLAVTVVGDADHIATPLRHLQMGDIEIHEAS